MREIKPELPDKLKEVVDSFITESVALNDLVSLYYARETMRDCSDIYDTTICHESYVKACSELTDINTQLAEEITGLMFKAPKWMGKLYAIELENLISKMELLDIRNNHLRNEIKMFRSGAYNNLEST